MHHVVTIDGPAASGKSSIACQLAKRLGFRFLDTGSMYRAVTWKALQQDVSLDDAEALARLVQDLELHLGPPSVRVGMGGKLVDVTREIRSPEVSAAVGRVADNRPIRRHLSGLQRRIAAQGNLVTEGRDQGTEVFPEAACKIYLTASPETRARRREQELRERGTPSDYPEVLRQLTERDQRDSQRSEGGLRKAEDAIEFATDDLSKDQVLDGLERLVRSRLGI
jgi:cytidylate kinase